jgi:hypothetical protein
MSDWADLGKARKKADRTYKNTRGIKSRFPWQMLKFAATCTPAECGNPLRSVSANESSLTSGAGAEDSVSSQRFVPNVAAFEPIVLKACPFTDLKSWFRSMCEPDCPC